MTSSTLHRLQKRRKQAREQGFTLVELAIVLVIIGLIVGGVLVGQDLIKAAELQTVVRDIENYNSAATTFRTKYGGYPGDLLNTRAIQFGFVNSAAGGDGLGDGDGVIENGAAAAPAPQGVGAESMAFWVHLSQADLLKDAFSASDAAFGGVVQVPGANVATRTGIDQTLPATRINETVYYHAFGANNRNYFHISNATQITAATGAITGGGTGLTNLQAFNLDEKLDDSDPVTGTMVAVTDINTPDAGVNPGVITTCVLNPTPDPDGAGPGVDPDPTDDAYFLDTTQFPDIQDQPNCAIQIRTSF